MYDPRVGRWFTIDPQFRDYPSLSGYVFTSDNPVIYIDFDGRDIIQSNRGSFTGNFEPKNIHDLGHASPRLAFSYTFNKKTNEIDINVNVSIQYSSLFNMMAKNNIEAENPGLLKEVTAHEEAHAKEFFEAAAKTKVSVRYGNKEYTGMGDEVLTGIFKDYKASLQKDVDAKIKNKVFKSQDELNKYVATKDAAFKQKFDKVGVEVLTKMQEGVNKEFDKSKLSQGEVQNIENRVNQKAAVKLNNKVTYLNGAKPVKHKGKVLPSN
jgi:rRNA-processing protein FCF1